MPVHEGANGEKIPFEKSCRFSVLSPQHGPAGAHHQEEKNMTLTGPREMKFGIFVHLAIRNDLSGLFGKNRDFTRLVAIFIKFKSRKSRFSQPHPNG